MARIYVSSTFSDLHDCREQVRLTLRRMDHDDVAMEYYTAEATRPLDKCLRDVEACDLYICLVAWRYGYIPEGHDYSITELEYRRAVEAGKPCLAFLLAEEAPWPFNLVESDAIHKVQTFRRELQRRHTISFFNGVEDIGARVAEAVHLWGKSQGLVTIGGRTDWEAYRAAVFDKHRWVRLAVIAGAKQDRRFAQIPLTEVFVAQRTTTGRPTYDVPKEIAGTDSPQPTEPFDPPLVLEESSLQILGREAKQVILGGPGSGKSTLFHFAMLALCDPLPLEANIPAGLRNGPLPFLVELRQYSLKKTADFVEYLVDQAREFYGVEIDADDLRAVLQQQGRALVLFDGLDEILKPHERAGVIERFGAFSRQYSTAGILVSSRIAGYDSEQLQLGGFSHHTIVGFGLGEIREFLPKWYRHYTWQGDERDAARLLQRIAESPRLLDLAANPLLLTMMAVIYKHQDLPEKRWQLYERCTQVLLEDWDVKRKNIERDELLPLDFRMVGEQKGEVLENVSMHMLLQHQEGVELNTISRGPLISILAGYLEQTYNKAPGDARAIATDILNHLRERTYILAEIGEGTFGFVHRTFMEYFAACHARAEFNRRRANYTWLMQEVFGANWQRDEWREVLLLLIAMIKDQDSPIEEIVDYLLHLESEQLPWNLEFAARCLGETGTAHGPWAQGILHELVNSILHWAGETSRDEIARFVDQGLAAFSLLVRTVQLPQDLRNTITEYAARSRRHAMVAWQMELALRSREERLRFAAAALKNQDEAVRLGAISALEREWPGQEGIGAALIEVLESDRVTRVRQAAIQALRRSWPEQPGSLEAIDKRTQDETAYTYVVWLAHYISTEWRRDPTALDVVLRLAGTKSWPARNYWYFEVAEAVGQGIVEGWADLPGMLSQLQERFETENDPRIRDGMLIGIAGGWPGAAGLLDWVGERIDGSSNEFVRSMIVKALAKAWSGHQEALTWLQQRAMQANEPRVRIASFRGIASGWHEDPRIYHWLERAAIDDADPEVRMSILSALSINYSQPAVAVLLQRQATEDVSASVRIQALILVGEYRDSSGELLPIYRIRDSHYWSWLLRRYGAGGRYASADVVTLLEAQAVDDPEPVVRKVALGGIYQYRASSSAAFDILFSRLGQDPSPSVRGMALVCLASVATQNPRLPEELFRALDLEGLLLYHRGRVTIPVSRTIRKLGHLEEQLHTAFKERAERDTDLGMRTAAALAVACIWPKDSATVDWLRNRQQAEQDSRATSLLEEIFIWLG